MPVLSDRIHQSNFIPADPTPFRQMVDRRLSIAQKGLDEARQHLASGQAEDVDLVLEKIDEDLHLLRRRLSSEAETVARRPTVRYGRADAISEAN
jgi:hypothetical protein